MKALDKLKELDLSEYPINEIKGLLNEIENIGYFLTDYHSYNTSEQPKIIERAVNNPKNEPEFKNKSRISYKPAEFNTTYMRASTPKCTMFYGSVFSDMDYDEGQKRLARIVGSTEISTLLRSDEILEGWSRITFGKWVVSEKMTFATIIDPTKNYNHKCLNSLRDEYLKFLDQLPVVIRENNIEFSKFISEEFSKYVATGNNHEYLITALFTEHLLNKKQYDGIIYPSVQTDGYGLCIAIHPSSVKKLNLIRVLQCKLIKSIDKDGSVYCDLKIEKSCEVEPYAEEFNFKKAI